MVPAVRALTAAGLKIGVLCHIEQADFWSAAGCGVVIPHSHLDWVRNIAHRLAGQWKAALCWHTGFAANCFSRAEIPVRMGPEDPGLRPRLTQTFKPLPPGPATHRVRFYLQALEEMGIPTRNPEFFQPLAGVGDGARPQSETLLVTDSDFGTSHEWEIDRWESIARRLLERGCQLHVAVADSKRSSGHALLKRLGTDANMWELGPVSGWLQRLAGFGRVFAVDGTLPHLASLAGADCATWFGPNDPAWRRPLGRRHLVIQQHVECAPCLASKCRMNHRCMVELTADHAWSKISKWIES